MFTLLSTEHFSTHDITGRLYRHECGLEVLSLEACDSENLFALCFRTEPTDDTGVAHIIEHSVLEGSRKYPVKDPFVCMLKTSVATFINAMTYPDRTIYPCSSCCRKDYFNLFDVYWDAVFHPNLTRDTFMQEGWHFELSGKGAKRSLKYNGIVYNEMSGAYSSPERLFGRSIEKKLFGYTYARYDSGGEPSSIPQLTYNAFKRFHNEHYAPSVARIVLYGDIPTEDKLAYIERQLKQTLPSFPAVKRFVDCKVSSSPSRKMLNSPCRIVKRSIPEPGASLDETIVGLAWDVSTSPRDSQLDLGFQLLENVLFGSAGAPLTLALMRSHIGSAPLSSGYDNETNCCSFSVAMRGVKKNDCAKFEKIVLDELKRIVDEGLDATHVQTAVAAFQVENQAIDSNYVIELMEDIIASWNYGDDPYIFLRQSEQLPLVQEVLKRNPRYFEDLIQKHLLENPRRISVQLLPDPELKCREEAKEAQRLSAIFSRWKAHRIQKVARDSARLHQNALMQDTAEALATLPQLNKTDLPAVLPPWPYEDGCFANGLRFRRGTMNYNGIAQMNAIADIGDVSTDLLLDIPLFCQFFKTLGNEKYGYAQNSAMLSQHGVTYSLKLSAGSSINSPAYRRILEFECNGLEENYPFALQMFRQQLEKIIFTENARMVEILRACSAQWTANLTKRSNLRICNSRALYGMMEFGGEQEAIFGIGGYFTAKKYGCLKAEQLEPLAERMRAVAAYVLTRPMVAVGCLGNDSTMASIEAFCNSFGVTQQVQSATAFVDNARDIKPLLERHEFCGIATNVASCVRTMQAPHTSTSLYAPTRVLARMLSSGYLWDEIRAKGGAYHAHAKYVPALRYLELASSEDPNPENTYCVFENILNAMENTGYQPSDCDKAILACCGRYMVPIRPVGYAADLASKIVEGADNSTMQREYERLRAVTPKSLRDACEAIFAIGSRRYNDCAIGPKGALGDFKQISLKK